MIAARETLIKCAFGRSRSNGSSLGCSFTKVNSTSCDFLSTDLKLKSELDQSFPGGEKRGIDRAKQMRGTVFVEFTIILPIFFLFIVAIADVTRFFTVQIILQHAAARGLSSAQTLDAIEFDFFIHDAERGALKEVAREFIIEETLSYPRAVLPWIAEFGTGLKFRPYRHLGTPQDSADTVASLEAMVLFPGESAAEIHREITQEPGAEEPKIEEVIIGWQDHFAVCAGQSPSCTNPIRNSVDFPEFFVVELLRKDPIIIEIALEFHFFFPGFAPRMVQGRAAGYRERLPLVRR